MPYIFTPGSNRRWLILCDHASNRIPPSLLRLGVDRANLREHIAYDIGALGVARRLARHLQAPLFAHGYSRLLADANRDARDPALAPAISDGVRIPGNEGLTAVDYAERAARFHEPYHRAVRRYLQRTAPFIVSVHSFTPQMNGFQRPWPAGVLWRDNPTLAHKLIAALGEDGTLIGDNQPYDGHVAMGATLERHAIAQGRPYTMFEIRQNEISNPSGQRYWSLKLFRALGKVAGS